MFGGGSYTSNINAGVFAIMTQAAATATTADCGARICYLMA